MYIRGRAVPAHRVRPQPQPRAGLERGRPAAAGLRPVHLLRVFLLRVLESNFPGDSLSNSTDMRIPTP